MAKENEFVEKLKDDVNEDVVNENKISDLGTVVESIVRGEKVDDKRVEELLDIYGDVPIIIDGKVTNTYTSPISAEILNRAYKEKTGEDHPNYVEHQPKIVKIKLEHQKTLEGKIKDQNYFEELSLIDKKLKMQKEINEEENNVIKDPKNLENMKKELAIVEKQIVKGEEERVLKQGDVVGKNIHKKDQESDVKKEEKKDEETKEEKKLYQDKEQKEKEDVEKLQQTYHDSMVALYVQKIQSIEKQIQKGALVSSKEDYEIELNLEAAMYEARDAYLNTGKEDPYREKRTEYIKLEKEARDKIEIDLRNRTKRFKEIEIEINNIDKREREINEELMNPNINESQIAALQKELVEISGKREKLELERADIKDKLDNAMETRRERLIQRAGLERQFVDTLTYKDMKNYNYQQSKMAVMNNNFDQATKLHYQNIKRRIEEREQKIKDINKELREVPETDFERRLVLLNELDKETNMLESDREAKRDLDRGITPSKQEMKQEAVEKVDEEEYRQKEFDKSTEEVREVVKEQKERIGQEVVEHPEEANREEKDRENTLKAATVATIYDDPKPGNDTPLEDVGQFVVAKCVIEGLEDKVRDPNNPEDAKAIVEQDEQLKEADKELDKIQDNLQKN